MTTELMDNELGHPEVESAARTAGSVLKAERERRGLSEQVVADQLHITKHYVRAIESDSYEKLPGKVFARGYIKSYGLLLELNEDEVAVLYDEFLVWKSDEEQEAVRLSAAQNRNSQIFPWLIFSALAFIIGILCFWAFNSFFSSAEITGTGNELWKYRDSGNVFSQATNSGTTANVLQFSPGLEMSASTESGVEQDFLSQLAVG